MCRAQSPSAIRSRLAPRPLPSLGPRCARRRGRGRWVLRAPDKENIKSRDKPRVDSLFEADRV